jgi:hypothetical protein
MSQRPRQAIRLQPVGARPGPRLNPTRPPGRAQEAERSAQHLQSPRSRRKHVGGQEADSGS